MKLSWTGGEAGAFDSLPMGLANDRTKKRKRNTGRDSKPHKQPRKEAEIFEYDDTVVHEAVPRPAR